MPAPESRIVVIGPQKSGKTSLVTCLLRPEDPFIPEYDKTIGAGYNSLHLPTTNIRLQFWDTAGSPEYKSFASLYMRDALLMIYCMDLSAEYDPAPLQAAIQDFTTKSLEKSAIILVGTCADKKENAATMRAFTALQQDGRIQGHFITSSKTQQGRNALLQAIKAVAEDSISREEAAAYHTFAALLKIEAFPEETREAIDQELKSLFKILQLVDSNELKVDAIHTFEANCYKHLAGSHPTLKMIAKAIAVLAIAAMATAITIGCGVSLGVAIGVWSSWSLFLSNIPAAATVIAISTGVGATAVALTYFSMFKKSPHFAAVQEFSEEQRSQFVR